MSDERVIIRERENGTSPIPGGPSMLRAFPESETKSLGEVGEEEAEE